MFRHTSLFSRGQVVARETLWAVNPGVHREEACVTKLFYNCPFKNSKHICEAFTINYIFIEETRGREPPERWCKESQTRARGEWRQWGHYFHWNRSCWKHGGGGGQLSRVWTLASFPLFSGPGETNACSPTWSSLDYLITFIKTMRLYRKQFGYEM